MVGNLVAEFLEKLGSEVRQAHERSARTMECAFAGGSGEGNLAVLRFEGMGRRDGNAKTDSRNPLCLQRPTKPGVI